MRIISTVAALLLIPLMVATAAEKAKAPEKAEAPKEKPKIRTIQMKSGALLFNVRLEPGVPDPGKLVEVTIEMSEVPPVPDPIYGERIPVKDAEITAKITDVDGAGYTMAYRVHTLQDAGSYGFHFTPARKDNYKMELTGVFKNKRYSTTTRVPVGIWPFTSVDAKGNVSRVPAHSASSRLPALPSGMKSGDAPSSNAKTKGPSSKKRTPLQTMMKQLGDQFARAGVALLAGRKPDLKDAKAAAIQMNVQAKAAAELPHVDGEYKDLMNELVGQIDKFEKASSAGKAKSAVSAFNKIGSHHCNRCHFKLRWNIIKQSSAFPANLP
jgi:soluble cytochrome b562